MNAVEATEWIEITQKIKVTSSPDCTTLMYEDGIPMESDWHRAAMNLLIEILAYYWRERTDFYVAGNMFIYFDPNQVKKRNFRGPDFFAVKGVSDYARWRDAWILWEEGGLPPNLVIELTSPSTEAEDKGPKKEVYERILRVPEYLCYNPYTQELVGWRLQAGRYAPIRANEQGWLWSEELDLWIGFWRGKYLGRTHRWVRFFDANKNLILAEWEAEAAAHQAEAAARQAAETEIARLKAKLNQLNQDEA